MKYIFWIILHLALKPILALILSIIFYGLIAFIFILEFIWSLDIAKAISSSKMIWHAEDKLNRSAEKYWYYKTPFDHVYGRKKWTTRNNDHLF